MTTRTPASAPMQRPRKAEFQVGYRSVLVREELKQKLQEWQVARGLTDSHYQRCVVSALIELGLAEEHQEQLFQILSRSVQRDFELSAGSFDRHEHSTESRAIPARSLRPVA